MCTQSQDTDLGLHSIDMSGKSEWSIDIRDKKNGRDYKLLIFNDKNLKIVRIVNSKDHAF